MDSEAKYQPLSTGDTSYGLSTNNEAAQRVQDHPRLTKSRRFLLFATAALALVAITYSQTRRYAIFDGDTVSAAILSENFTGSCASTDPIPVQAPHKNVWKNLDVDEATAIRNWVWDDERGFNLTRGIHATDLLVQSHVVYSCPINEVALI